MKNFIFFSLLFASMFVGELQIVDCKPQQQQKHVESGGVAQAARDRALDELHTLNEWFGDRRVQLQKCCLAEVPNCSYHMQHTLTDAFAKFYVELLVKCVATNGTTDFQSCCRQKGVQGENCVHFCNLGDLGTNLLTPEAIEQWRNYGGQCFRFGEAIAACIDPEYSSHIQEFNDKLTTYSVVYHAQPYLRKSYNFFALV